MYSVKPYLETTNITPANIMYHVASYHQPREGPSGKSIGSALNNSTNEYVTNVKKIQQEIITRLNALHDSLVKLNLNGPSSGLTNSVKLSNFTSEHSMIIQLLSAYAKTKNVSVEIIQNKSDITVHYSGPASAGDISSAEKSLKWLAEALGIYSTKSAASQDKWIYVAGQSTDLATNTVRDLSRSLSANDFLGTSNSITLADLVFRARFVDKNSQTLTNWKNINAPNNVQLWIKRVDEILSL